jgi:hypothetical protein
VSATFSGRETEVACDVAPDLEHVGLRLVLVPAVGAVGQRRGHELVALVAELAQLVRENTAYWLWLPPREWRAKVRPTGSPR